MRVDVGKLLNFAGVLAVPLLLASLSALGAAWSALADHRVKDAVVEKRVEALEIAAALQSGSAARIESSVTAMRVQQAEFVGAVGARLDNLEKEQHP